MDNITLKDLLLKSTGRQFEKRVQAAIQVFGEDRVVFTSGELTIREFEGAHFTKGISVSFCHGIAKDMWRCARRLELV